MFELFRWIVQYLRQCANMQKHIGEGIIVVFNRVNAADRPAYNYRYDALMRNLLETHRDVISAFRTMCARAGLFQETVPDGYYEGLRLWQADFARLEAAVTAHNNQVRQVNGAAFGLRRSDKDEFWADLNSMGTSFPGPIAATPPSPSAQDYAATENDLPGELQPYGDLRDLNLTLR